MEPIPALVVVLLLPTFSGRILLAEDIQTRKFVLQDYFGTEWPEQMIQSAVGFSEGTCHQDSLILTAQKTQLPIPFQIHEAENWPGSPFLKRCTIFWRSGLAKNTSKTWTLTYSIRAAVAKSHPNPFKWKSTNDHLELSNKLIGIALPPEGEITGSSISRIPPPLKKLRGPDGIWFGEGKWALNQKWKRVQIEKTADGPIFSEVTASYFAKDSIAYRVKFQLPAEEDFVLIHDYCHPDLHASSEWSLNLSRNFKPDRKRDFQYYQAQPPSPLKVQGTLAHLRPWTFAQIFTHRDYLGVHQSEGRNDAVGLMAINGSAWRRGNGQPYWPEANFSSRDGWKLPDLDQAVQLVRENNGDVVVRLPLCGGQRITGLAVYDKSRDHGRYVLEDIRQKTSETPLDDVLKMVLDWDEKTPRPYLYGSKKVFDEQREKYDPKNPENRWVCEEFRALMTSDVSDAEKIRKSMVTAARELAGYWTFPEPFEPAEIEKSRGRKGYVGTGLRAIEVGPKARNLAGRYDLACALGILNEDDRRIVRAALSFAAYKFSDPEFFAPLCALGNFKIDGYFSLAVIALTFPNHPHSERWLAEAKRQLAEDLDQGIYIYESGTGNECEIYRAMSINFLTQLAMLFRIHRMPELAEHPRLQEALKWFMEFSVPPVPKVSYGLPRVLPFDGDTTTTTSPVYGMFGIAAVLLRKSHPQLSKQFSWFWKQSKQTPFRGHGINNLGVINRLYLRYDLPDEPPGSYGSRPVKGYGFVFHRNWGKPDEWMIFGKAGPGSGHYHASDGSIQIYAYGKPLVIGYGKYPYITTTWRYTTLRLDGRSNWSRGTTGPVFTSEHLDAAEMHVPVVNVSKNKERTIQEMVKSGQITDSTWDAVMDVPSSHFDRSVIFNRADNYVVVFDRAGPRYNSDWFTHVMSERHTVKDRLIQFTGKFGVDLDFHILAPTNAKPFIQGPIATQYDAEIKSKAFRWSKNNVDQQVLQLSGPPNCDYLTVFHPKKSDDRVRPLNITKKGPVYQIESETSTNQFVCSRKPVQANADGFIFHGSRGGMVKSGDVRTLLMLSGTKIGINELTIETTNSTALVAEIFQARFRKIVIQAKAATSLKIGQAKLQKIPAGRTVILADQI